MEQKSKLPDIVEKIFLILIGAIITLFSQQIFFKKNKITDAEIEIKKERFKEELTALNKIVKFAAKSETSKTTYADTRYRILTFYNNKRQFVREDTVLKADENIRIFELPLFVNDSLKRKEFLSEIDDINSDKDKVDFSVWFHFQKILFFLQVHPLPIQFNYEEVSKSSWLKLEVRDEWDVLKTNLSESAWTRLDKPFD